jgi:hypothetical protein
LSVIILGGRVRVKQAWEKRNSGVGRKTIFIVEKDVGKIELSVVIEWFHSGYSRQLVEVGSYAKNEIVMPMNDLW